MANIADVSISMSLDANGVVQGAASVTKAVDDVAKSANDAAKMFDFAGEAMQQFAEWEKQAAATTQALVAPLDDTRVAMQQVVQMQQELGRLFEKTRTPVERLEAQLKHLDELRPFANTPDQMQAVQRATDDVVEKLRKLEDAELDAAEAAKKLAAESDMPVVVGKIAPAVDTVTNKLDAMAGVQGRATLAAMNFSRVIQDAPFGILGVANNIEPLLQSLQTLRKDADAAGVKTSTLGLIFKELSGATGILVGAGALGALATIWPVISKAAGEAFVKLQQFMNGVDVSARTAAQSFKVLDDAAKASSLSLIQNMGKALDDVRFRLDLMKDGIFDAQEQMLRLQKFQAQAESEASRRTMQEMQANLQTTKNDVAALQGVLDSLYENALPDESGAPVVDRMQVQRIERMLQFQKDRAREEQAAFDSARRRYDLAVETQAAVELSVNGQLSALRNINELEERRTATQKKYLEASKEKLTPTEQVQIAFEFQDMFRKTLDDLTKEGIIRGETTTGGTTLEEFNRLSQAEDFRTLAKAMDEYALALDELQSKMPEIMRQEARTVMNQLVSIGQGALFSSGLGASAGGALGGAIGTMFGSPQVGAAVGEEIGRAISPALDELANKLGVIEPIMATFDAVIGVLTPVFQALLPAVEGLRAGIEPLIKPLQDVLAFFAIPLFAIARAFQIVALIVGMVGKAFEFLTKPLYDAAFAVDDFFTMIVNGFVDFFNWIIDAMNSIGANIDRFERVQNIFLDRNTEAVEKNTEAVQSFAEALTNVPSGFKINAARFRSTMPVFTGGGGITVQSMTVVANNPDQLHKQLQKMNANRSNLRIGNIGAAQR